MNFAGKTAVITGAGRGLGFVYAQALARRGANVVVSDIGADRLGSGAIMPSPRMRRGVCRLRG